MVEGLRMALRLWGCCRWLSAVLLLGSLTASNKPVDDGIIKTRLDSPAGLMSATLPFTLEGWVMSREPVQTIEVGIDEQAKFVVPLDIARPDVLATFPEHKNAYAAGFKTVIDREKYGLYDTHRIKVEAITAQGARQTIAETTVIANKTQRQLTSPAAPQGN